MDRANVDGPETAVADECRAEPVINAPWRALLYFTAKRHLPFAVSAVVFSIIAGCIVPAESYLFGKVFGEFAKFGGGAITKEIFVDNVDKYCVWLAMLGAVAWLLHGGDFSSWTLYGSVQAAHARDRLFMAMLDRDMEWFDMRKHGVSALLARLNLLVTVDSIPQSATDRGGRYIMEFQEATSLPLGLVVQNTTCTVASLGVALYFAWDLTLVTISILPLAAIAMWFCSRNVQPNIDAQAEKLGEAAKLSTNAISSIDSVKCYNGQEMELWAHKSVLDEASRFYNRQIYWNSAQAALLRLVTLGMFVQGFWYGSHLVQTRQRDAGAVVTTFWSTMMATQAFMSIMPAMIMLEKGRVAGAKLRAVVASIEDKPIRLIENRPITFQTCFGNISISGLYFSYPGRPEQPILKDVSIEIPGGRLTFLIGKSGSGKSTIGQLLMRFYKFEHGHVLLDGQSINEMNLEWLRDNVFLVEQTSVLFQETAARNIAFGRKDFNEVTKEDVKAAANFALLGNLIQDMPKGFDTLIGAKGSTLSGGQRQRMALARARLRDPPVLILDESTSALDYINRKIAMENIRKWRRGKTTIVITHDITQILPDDLVYLLKNGEVVQRGIRREMEAGSASHFQSFLQEDDTGQLKVEVVDIEMDQPLTTGKPHPMPTLGTIDDANPFSDDSPSPPTLQPSLDLDDPLDLYLNQRGLRDSMDLPSVFTHQSGSPAQRGTMRPASIGSPFWRGIPLSAPSSLVNMDSSQRELTARYSSDTSDSKFSLQKLDLLRPVSGLLQRRIAHANESRRSATLAGSDNSSHWKSEFISKPAHAATITGQDTYEMAKMTEVRLNSLEKENVEDFEEAYDQEINHTSILTLKSIFRTMWPQISESTRLLFVFAIFWLLVYAVSTPIFSWIFSKLLSTFYVARDARRMAMIYSLAILGITIVDAIAIFCHQSQLYIIGQVWINKLRYEGFRRILDQPREFFDEPGNEVSRIAETLDARAEMMQGLLGRFLPSVILASIMMTVAVVWSLVASWKLTLVGLATMPVMYMLTHMYSTVAGKLDAVAQGRVENVSAVFTETFTSIKTVKSLTMEGYFAKKFKKYNHMCLQAAVKRALVSGLFYGLAECAITFVIALLFHYGAVLAANHEFTVEDILIVFTELLFGLANVQAILGLIPQMSTCRDAASRLLHLTRLPGLNFEHQGTARITTIGDISFTNCNFYYPSRPDQLILKDFTLNIPMGSCIALVGSSGSGKSTIASLLLKLYNLPDAAFHAPPTITLSGRDIRRIHTPSLRSLITTVSQTPFLFPASIAENITYGLRTHSPHTTTDAIRAAARAAGVDDFVMSLPEGYDTLVGEGGLGVSGGQAQRISIARALVRRPRVLVLDEATSALDVESAAVVRESVRRLLDADRQQQRVLSSTTGGSRGKRSEGRGSGERLTVIIITHAKEMMRMADSVVMLDRGRVVEQGAYEELMRRKGPFSSLIKGEDWTQETKAIQRRSLRLLDKTAGVSPGSNS